MIVVCLAILIWSKLFFQYTSYFWWSITFTHLFFWKDLLFFHQLTDYLCYTLITCWERCETQCFLELACIVLCFDWYIERVNCWLLEIHNASLEKRRKNNENGLYYASCITENKTNTDDKNYSLHIILQFDSILFRWKQIMLIAIVPIWFISLKYLFFFVFLVRVVYYVFIFYCVVI